MFKIDEYLKPRCSYHTLDNFIIRQAIIAALRPKLIDFRGIVLDIGCGYMPYKSLVLSPPSKATNYIGMDLRGEIYQTNPQIYWDTKIMPLKNDSVDCVMATEVLEHCPTPETLISETFRVLKPGGLWFFTVPFLWPLHDVPYDEYRYTPFALKRLLTDAGFDNIQLKPTGGWDASLAQMLGLWVRRRPMSRLKRRLLRPFLSLFFWPFIWFLHKTDKPPEFRESPMITGISGTAIKPL